MNNFVTLISTPPFKNMPSQMAGFAVRLPTFSDDKDQLSIASVSILASPVHSQRELVRSGDVYLSTSPGVGLIGSLFPAISSYRMAGRLAGMAGPYP
jgi:hypothetical protein